MSVRVCKPACPSPGRLSELFLYMNVSSARRNIPKDIKSLKSNLSFMSITSILCRIEANHPVTRLPAANAAEIIIAQKQREHKFCFVNAI